MGILTREKTGEQFVLQAETVIGRSRRSCNLILEDPVISGSHAELVWNHRGWRLRDLNSRNGTAVNGVTIAQVVYLQEGCRLNFGASTDTWILTSALPPTIHARAVPEGPLVYGVGDLLTLPDESNPEVTIYRDEEKGWVAEGGEALTTVEDGAEILAGGKLWRLNLPVLRPDTVDIEVVAPTVGALRLHFEVTRDEEHVRIRAARDGESWDLGARAHHYMLLLLARQRLKEAARRDLPTSAHGWMYQSDLMQMLGTDFNNFNVHVFRARQQFAELKIEDAAHIIERRLQTRQLRIGASNLVIEVI